MTGSQGLQVSDKRKKKMAKSNTSKQSKALSAFLTHVKVEMRRIEYGVFS